MSAAGSGNPAPLVLAGVVLAVSAWSLLPRRAQYLGALDGSGSPHTDDRPVAPLVECVSTQADGSLAAHFGYRNENAADVTIPVGPHNRFAPGPADRGQPRVFREGRSPLFPAAAFRVAFSGEALVWTVRSPNGEVRAAAATRESPRCPGAAAPAEPGPKAPEAASPLPGVAPPDA